MASDDALTDIVAPGFDAGARLGFDAGVRLGEMIAQEMVALRLTLPFQAIMVATPGYLASRVSLTSIRDLDRHNCIGFRLAASRGAYAWEVKENGRSTAVDVRGTVLVINPSYSGTRRSQATPAYFRAARPR